MSESQDVQFVCAACNKSYTGDTSDVMTECRVCHRIHCNQCVDEFGSELTLDVVHGAFDVVIQEWKPFSEPRGVVESRVSRLEFRFQGFRQSFRSGFKFSAPVSIIRY